MLVAFVALAACANRDDSASTTVTTATPSTDPPDTGAPDTGAPVTDPPDTETPDTGAPDTTDSGGEPGVFFGTLPSPCGPGDPALPASVAADENGGDVIRVAAASDKGAVAAPGLNAELYDAAVAFAGWCNAQGGIRGLPIEVVDADAKLFEVPAAMERVCAQAFAMVGGGWAFDDQQFPRFHECGMIDIAGFTVTTGKAMSDRMVQPMPNPSDAKNGNWFRWAAREHPSAVASFATLTGDIATTRLVEEQYVEMMGTIPEYQVVDRIVYNSAGEATWAPIVQRLKDKGVRAITFVGAPEMFALLLKAMDELGFRPELILQEASFYVDSLIAQAAEGAEGVIATTAYAPFEEADRFPGLASYLEMMAEHRPGGKVAGLGLQATSAYLLFAQSAAKCIDANGGVLTRSCVLAEAAAVSEWTGGGLHAPTVPGSNRPAQCSLLMEVVGGRWQRHWPALGSADDNGGGWHCDPANVIELTGDYGDVTIGRLP